MFCKNCGAQVAPNANVCSQCGYPTREVPPQPQSVVYNNTTVINNVISPKSRWIAFVLCFFFGGIGVHRFYAGKIGTGILWLLTGGLFGIGWFIDWIVILCGNFRDGMGLVMRN